MNVAQDELSWQLQQSFKQVARDVEKSFIQGTYLLPPDNGQARRTRGLLQAINTNKLDRAGAPNDPQLRKALWKYYRSRS